MPKVRDGKPALIHLDNLTQRFVCMPDTFECEITSRDEKSAGLIREDWEGAKKEYIDILTGTTQRGCHSGEHECCVDSTVVYYI